VSIGQRVPPSSIAANTRYYVIDGLGHVRALVAPNGAITEVWHYDSWGNLISLPAQRIDQPFTWNGAYGWTYTPFTELYHLNPDYDPRTARYLQRQGSNPTNPYIAQENDPINNIDENLSSGGTQGLLQRGLPKDQRQQLVGTLKASGQFVAELHPGVLATEAAYGRDCYGEQLSALERMGAAVGAIGGFLGRLGRLASNTVQTVSRAASRAYAGVSARVNQLKRAWQIQQALKKVNWSKVPKPNVQDPKLQNIVNQLYRPGAQIGNGSTADAIRYEKATGCPVGGRWHAQKGWDYVRALQRWLQQNPNASASDRQAAQDILDDLLDALNWVP